MYYHPKYKRLTTDKWKAKSNVSNVGPSSEGNTKCATYARNVRLAFCLSAVYQPFILLFLSLHCRDVPDTTLPDTGFNRIVVYQIPDTG